MVLRAKIDMASPNMHFRDPIIYRVVKHPHHRTGTMAPSSISPLFIFWNKSSVSSNRLPSRLPPRKELPPSPVWNEEDFKRVRRLQQYLHRQYKDCSRKRYSIILEALAYAIDYDKSFIYDLSMADKKLKKMYLEDFMEGFDYALYDSRYEENEAEE